MPNFKYIAKDREGKTASGIVEAKTQVEAIDVLRKKDLIIVSVAEAAKKFDFKASFGGKKKVKLDDLVVFSRQLATMADAGIPLVGALDILGDQIDNRDFGAVITSIRNDVETGSSLSEGLAKHKDIFSTLFINMVKAGESSGMLDEILDRLAEYLEKTSSLQKKVSSAMVYPMIVSSMAFLITFVMIWKIVPIFKTIFEGFGARLPIPTMILVSLSEFIQKYIILIVFVLGTAIFLINRFIRTEKGRVSVDGLLLNLPVFGMLFRKVAISKFTRTLSTLIKSGVPILAALEIVARTSGNKVVEAAIDSVRANVREGESVAEPLARSKIFPPMVTRMVSVGEQSGELEKMLSKIADFYDEQVDTAVGALTSMIEPLIIAFMGIVIGGIVVAMFLPIFKMTEVVGL